MLKTSRCFVLMLGIALLSSASWGQEKKVEPTPEQLKKMKDDFAKIGASEGRPLDWLSNPTIPCFRFASTTKDVDLKKIPNQGIRFGLDLSGTEITDKGLAELKQLKNLSHLDISGTKITNAGLKELKDVKSLTSLDITRTKGIKGYQELKDLKSLTSLNIGVLNDGSFKALREVGLLHCLLQATNQDRSRPTKPDEVASLDLSFTQITDKGLAELKEFKNLKSLNLQAKLITDQGLVDLKELKNLNSLNLSYTRITDKGLVELKELKNLTHLSIVKTNVTDAGLDDLRKLEKLVSLGINETKITDAGLKELEKALPKCKISR